MVNYEYFYDAFKAFAELLNPSGKVLTNELPVLVAILSTNA